MEFAFEWDENKRLKNIEKHGIDFNRSSEIFEGVVYTFQDTRADYGEDRFVSVGLLDGHEVSVIHTPRGENVRIISIRRARDKERKLYYGEAEKVDGGLREPDSNEG